MIVQINLAMNYKRKFQIIVVLEINIIGHGYICFIQIIIVIIMVVISYYFWQTFFEHLILVLMDFMTLKNNSWNFFYNKPKVGAFN